MRKMVAAIIVSVLTAVSFVEIAAAATAGWSW
jgi:hypothetical protein